MSLVQEEKSGVEVSIKKRRYTNAELRQSHVNNWKLSGMTMREYCREHDLVLSSLSAWVQADKLSKQTFKPITVTAPLVAPMKQSGVIEILISDKLKIRLIDLPNTSLVVEIAKELMRCN